MRISDWSSDVCSSDLIDWVGDVPTTAARVVAGAPSNFSHTVEIDKGTDDGVREGMPVITGAGLAGKVVQATGGRSTVQLITDPEFKVGIRILSNNRTGTATGRGPGEQLIVDTSLTPEDAEVRRGTALTTSGTRSEEHTSDLKSIMRISY